MNADLKVNKSVKNVLHYPRLDTVMRVEKILRDAGEPLYKNEIDRRLSKKVMRTTLNVILGYLEESGKIGLTKSGILWIWHEDISTKLKNKMKNSIWVI